MYYSYVEIEYVATSFSPARTDLALKLLTSSWKHVPKLHIHLSNICMRKLAYLNCSICLHSGFQKDDSSNQHVEQGILLVQGTIQYLKHLKGKFWSFFFQQIFQDVIFDI